MVITMHACKKYQELIAASWFGDLSPKEHDTLMRHVESCTACREALELGAKTLSSIGKQPAPALPDHFWDGYWLRLTQRMDKDDLHARAGWRTVVADLLRAQWPPALRLATAAVIFAAGVLISRMWWAPEPATHIAETSSPPPPRYHLMPVDTRTDDLLSRSKVLLIGLSSLDQESVSEKDFSFSVQRRVSRELLAETTALRNATGAKNNRQLLELINQLEIVLLQIANLEAEHDISAVDLVRTSIDREGLLLKINIEEMKRQALLVNSDKSL